jgi:hypothetical protein
LEAGGYLLPYLDVPKDHPRFKVYQRIGATGILKGTGMNVGWENQTWFFPEKPITNSDFNDAKGVLSQYLSFDTPESLKYQDLIPWFLQTYKTFHPKRSQHYGSNKDLLEKN